VLQNHAMHVLQNHVTHARRGSHILMQRSIACIRMLVSVPRSSFRGCPASADNHITSYVNSFVIMASTFLLQLKQCCKTCCVAVHRAQDGVGKPTSGSSGVAYHACSSALKPAVMPFVLQKPLSRNIGVDSRNHRIIFRVSRTSVIHRSSKSCCGS
jgi:hypothetical protein